MNLERDSGARNFGGGIVDCELLNPLYSEAELRRVFNRGKDSTTNMDEKDDRWETEYLPAFQEALAKRVEDDE